MLGAAAARRLPDYPRRSRLGGLDSDGSAARDTRRNHADMNEPKFIYTASLEVTDRVHCVRIPWKRLEPSAGHYVCDWCLVLVITSVPGRLTAPQAFVKQRTGTAAALRPTIFELLLSKFTICVRRCPEQQP
jgi:hypothetical protein